MIHWSVGLWMWPLLLVLVAGAVVYAVRTYGRTSPDPGKNGRRALAWLRGLAFGLLVLALGSPFLIRARVVAERPELLVLVEDSASMGLPAGPATGRPGQPTRWDRSLALCGRLQAFARAHTPPLKMVFVRGNGMSEPRVFTPESGAPPTALGTDLTGFVAGAVARRRGRPVGAVVLVSDGCEEEGQLDRGAAPAGGGRSVPAAASFHVVGVGDPVGPEDRLISDVRYPRLVHKGDEVVVGCVVEQLFHEAAPGDSLTLTLRDGEGELARATIADPGGSVPMELSFAPRGEGLQILTLSVSPLDNERFPANNQVSLGVSVRKERSRVLLVDLAPGWDGRFLAQAGLQEPRLDVQTVYPGLQGLVLADSLRPWPWPLTVDEWQAYDAVILDFARWPDGVNPASWTSLAQAVDAGLGLMLLPGPGFRSGPAGILPALPDPVAGLLPFGTRGLRWRPGEFSLAVKIGIGGHPVLAGLLTRAAGGGGTWESLPPLRGLLPVAPEAGADVLLVGRSGSRPALPALVLTGRGRGRVAWFGGNALWPAAFWHAPGAMRAGGEPQPGRRLLRNLLVWLGTGEETGGLRFDSELPLASSGRPVALQGSWRDMRGQPVTDGRVILEVEPLGDEETPARSYAAGSLDPATGGFTVRIPPLAAGRYRLILEGRGAASASAGPETLVVAASSLEDRQVRQDRRRLVQLAAAHQGSYTDAGDSAQVAKMLEDLTRQDWPQRRQTRRSRYDLTGGLPFLLVVVVLLGVEWYLRRRFGLL